VPEGAALCDNEIVVDVGGCCFGYSEPGATDSGKSLIFDHHFTRRDNYPSASAAVLHHASDIVELLDSHDKVEYFFALDQERAQGAHLYNLWAALSLPR